MGLLEHNREILARARNLAPLEPKLRRIYVDGKRAQLLAGEDAQGREFQPVKPATMDRRGGAGPPLSPRGAASQLVARYVVRFERLPFALRVVAGWPMDWVKHHRAGTMYMPKRDPGGFRQKDARSAMEALRDYIMRGRT